MSFFDFEEFNELKAEAKKKEAPRKKKEEKQKKKSAPKTVYKLPLTLKSIAGDLVMTEGEVDQNAFKEYRDKFEAALCDDLNTSMAITVLYDMLKADISDATKYALAESFDEVLSLNLTTAHAAKQQDNGVDAELETYVLAKIEERKAAKKEKDFAKADAIRAELLEKGIVLEDTREGVKWKKI